MITRICTDALHLKIVTGTCGFENAVYYPEDEGILLEFEERVIHTETYIVK